MDFITVSRVLNPSEAELVKCRLEANGFLVNVKNENAAFCFGTGYDIGGVLVQVPEAQAEEARALIESQDESPDPPAS
jgi:hypothetical protein